MGNKKFWEVKNSTENENTGETYIYGDIVSYKWDDTDTTAKSFKEDLDSLGDIDTLNIYINSPGGSVFQGQAIYNIIKRHKAKINIYVDGVAASIASVIAMAGDTIFMPKNSMMMIHNPWTFAWGNANELRKQADDLDKIRESLIEAYLSKAGDKLSKETLIEIMDNETWLTAQECYDYGLCDELVEEKEIAASISTELFTKYKNTPRELLNKTLKQKEPIKNTEKIEKDEEIEALIARVNNTLKFEEERLYE
ncbi:head maturation protease, ClpP-related [Clostridium tetani]|uniref:ATP-dependent Clp protease proteolytic subunit n=1 Tax=Clostridium tetani TaxID=1513 RepID=A0ABC8EG40_CLOTA|nr:head maturation protease, ClpP-related [Clostridium tetani]RXI58981.1 Clp protease ClpP [Clostridium tetani]BDR82549.1 ATP-dependent Clp protease proteolytic subunit [Clostridium tetani]